MVERGNSFALAAVNIKRGEAAGREGTMEDENENATPTPTASRWKPSRSYIDRI
jgi:hypothetical protein